MIIFKELRDKVDMNIDSYKRGNIGIDDLLREMVILDKERLKIIAGGMR